MEMISPSTERTVVRITEVNDPKHLIHVYIMIIKLKNLLWPKWNWGPERGLPCLCLLLSCCQSQEEDPAPRPLCLVHPMCWPVAQSLRAWPGDQITTQTDWRGIEPFPELACLSPRRLQSNSALFHFPGRELGLALGKVQTLGVGWGCACVLTGSSCPLVSTPGLWVPDLLGFWGWTALSQKHMEHRLLWGSLALWNDYTGKCLMAACRQLGITLRTVTDKGGCLFAVCLLLLWLWSHFTDDETGTQLKSPQVIQLESEK